MTIPVSLRTFLRRCYRSTWLPCAISVGSVGTLFGSGFFLSRHGYVAVAMVLVGVALFGVLLVGGPKKSCDVRCSGEGSDGVGP